MHGSFTKHMHKDYWTLPSSWQSLGSGKDSWSTHQSSPSPCKPQGETVPSPAHPREWGESSPCSCTEWRQVPLTRQIPAEDSYLQSISNTLQSSKHSPKWIITWLLRQSLSGWEHTGTPAPVPAIAAAPQCGPPSSKTQQIARSIQKYSELVDAWRSHRSGPKQLCNPFFSMNLVAAAAAGAETEVPACSQPAST